MPAIWTPPRTWQVGELATAALMNQQLRDNLDWLKSPTLQVHQPANAFLTTSTTWVDLWSPLTLVSNGGGFLVGAYMQLTNTAAGAGDFIDLMIDGVSQGGSEGIMGINVPAATPSSFPASFVRYISPLSAGSHTFKLRCRTTSGTMGVYMNAGPNLGYMPQFWVREA